MIDYNGMTSDEIKADIERTRSQMSHKIDTLQDRLSPDNIKQQAQTMVQDVVRESTDALIQYVNTNTQQMTNSILDAIRNNPVPAAVVGLGLGWLIMSTVKNGSDDRGANYYVGADRMNRPLSGSDYATYTGDMGATGYASGSGSSMRNPGYQDWNQSGQAGASQSWAYTGQTSEDKGGISEKASDIAGQVKDTAQQMADKVKHTASHLTDPAADMGDQLRHQAGDMGSQIKHQAGDLASQAQDQAQRLGGQAQQMTSQATRQAQHMGGQMQRTMQRSLEDNPLGFGLVALAAGVALGLALPATRPERQLMGDMSTRVLEKGQTAASNMMEEVKQVAADAAPKLQETARRVADDIAQTGRDATRDVKDTVKQAASSLSSATEQGQQQGSGNWQAPSGSGYVSSSGTSSSGSSIGSTTGGTNYTEKGYQGSVLQSGTYAGSAGSSEETDEVIITGDDDTALDSDTDSSATTNSR